jgi:hypothetical protein
MGHGHSGEMLRSIRLRRRARPSVGPLELGLRVRPARVGAGRSADGRLGTAPDLFTKNLRSCKMSCCTAAVEFLVAGSVDA